MTEEQDDDEAKSRSSSSVPPPPPPQSTNDADNNTPNSKRRLVLQKAGSDYGHIYMRASLSNMPERSMSDSYGTPPPTRKSIASPSPRPSLLYRKSVETYSEEEQYGEYDIDSIIVGPPPESPMSLQVAGSNYAQIYQRKSLRNLGNTYLSPVGGPSPSTTIHSSHSIDDVEKNNN